MIKVSFVILHYRTYEDTIECVQSIVSNVVFDHFYIIIVDNGSDNNSYSILQAELTARSNIIFLRNDRNLGFAEGNNVGYSYAKHELGVEFIIMINNDTWIDQPEFISEIIGKYNDDKYHMLGPDILAGKEKKHQNPRVETLNDPKIVRKFLRLHRRMLLLNCLGIDRLAIKIKKKIIPSSVLPTSVNPDLNPDNSEMHNVKLHGSAIVFSPLYIERYEYAFYPGTFMYSEESILNYIARRDGLKTIYYPDVKIHHKEDSATDTMFKGSLKKRRFYYRNFIKSGKVLLTLMKQYKTS